MPDTDREIGRLIAGQEMMQKSISSLAHSVENIAKVQTQILEIQAKHSSNAEMIEKNSKAISAVHRRVDPLEIDMAANMSFRKIVGKVFWIVVTPILASSSLASFYLIIRNM